MPADDALAEGLACGAGNLLNALRREPLLEHADAGAAGDAIAQEFLARTLRRARPDDAVLSEEGAEDPSRLAAERIWIIDPLDGTREFGEGRQDWAVHVALVVGGVPRAAAVAVPARGQAYLMAEPPQLTPRRPGPLRIAVSRSRPPKEATRLVARLGAELVPMGSAGYKAMAVVRGDVDAYVHAGGQYQWDSAAPVGVARSAGLHCSRIDGAPLVYGGPDPRLADLLVCRPESADDLLEALASADSEEYV